VVRRGKVKHDEIEDQIPSTSIKHEDPKNRSGVKQKGVFHKRDQTTASDDEDKEAIGKQLKDKFITEEIDEVFGTLQDQKIMEIDIPERL